MLSSRTTLAAIAAALLATPVVALAQDTTQKAPPPPPPKVVTPSLDFSGVVFGNYSIETDSAARAANGGNSVNKFDIERAYLTFKMPAGDRAMVRVTTDIKQGQGSSGAYNGWFVRLKYAYLEYNLVKKTANGASAFARLGMMTTPVIDHIEGFWPRYLSKTAVERAGFFSSSDLGVGAGVTFPNKLGEVYATLVNGNGYENPETNRFKDFAVRVSLTPLGQSSGLLKTLTISPWAYLGRNASKFATDSANPVTDGLERNRYGVFAGLKDPRLTLGAEWAQRVDESESGATPLDRTVASTTGRLLSGFAVIRPLLWGSAGEAKSAPSLGAVVRYDDFEPNTDVSGATGTLIAGVFWEPTKKTAISLDYQDQKPKNGLSGAEQKLWYVHWQVLF